jgi:hypothetical protein
MTGDVYRYTFEHSLDVADLEATATLAVLATESLHGASRVRLEADCVFDAPTRTCMIDARGEVGRDLNRLFHGFVAREFGTGSFQVERVPAEDCAQSAPGA